MKLAPLLPTLLAAAATAFLLSTGCGILTAPVSVPAAIAANGNFSFKGPLVDPAGAPLTGVLLAQRLDHYFWTPIAGGTDTDEHHLRRLDGKFDVEERGRILELTFTKDGYYDASYRFNASNPKTVIAGRDDAWPNTDGFPVVLYPRTPADTRLTKWADTFDYSDYPRQHVIDLSPTGLRNRLSSTIDASNPGSIGPNLLYLTLANQTPRALDAKGDVDPADVNLPGQIALHISGAADNGFIRIAPRLGYDPIQSSDAAPTTGYQPTFPLDRTRLREMRNAESDRVIEAHEYFFFQANGHFGKGYIRWCQSSHDQPKMPLPLAFYIYVLYQPLEGDSNLTTHDPASF